MPLVAERMNKLTEAVPMLGFLFVDEAEFRRTDEIDEAGREVVAASYDALAALPDWSTAAIEDGPARGSGRGARAQAPARLRAGPRRRDRQPGQPAALRVAGAARSRAVARPPRGRTRVSEAGAPAGLPYHRLQEAGLPGWWRPVVGTLHHARSA